MQIAICDDEDTIRELLGDKVKALYPDSEFNFYQTGDELLAEECQPDILFLDIKMPGKDGMKTAGLLRKKWKDTILIFVTALEEYVFQAFDVGAFHYLVKPFTDEKFREVLTNAVNQLNGRSNLDESVPEKYMMINSGGSHMKILLSDIVYAEVFNRKVIIHKQDAAVEYYGKLSGLEKSLGEDFFRPHRSYLVNFRYIIKYSASYITMKNGTVPIAKANFPEFVRKYMQYNRREGKEIR